MNEQESMDIISVIAHEKKINDFNMRESSKYRTIKQRLEERPIEFFRTLYWEITGETTRKRKQEVLRDLGNLLLRIVND